MNYFQSNHLILLSLIITFLRFENKFYQKKISHSLSQIEDISNNNVPSFKIETLSAVQIIAFLLCSSLDASSFLNHFTFYSDFRFFAV